MSNPTPINPDPKRLIDRAAAELAAALDANLSWLTTAYSKADLRDDGNGLIPVIYTGTHNDTGYLNLLPDRKLGDYCFFLPEQKQEIMPKAGYADHMVKGMIIFSFDIRNVYPNDHNERTIENVKYDIIDILERYPFVSFKLRLTQICEGARQVFRNISHREIKSQFDLRPHLILGINIDMKLAPYCEGAQEPLVTLPTGAGFGLDQLNDGPGDYSGDANKFVRINPDGDGFIYDDVPAIGGITEHSGLTLDDGTNPHNTDVVDLPASAMSDDYLAIYILSKNT